MSTRRPAIFYYDQVKTLQTEQQKDHQHESQTQTQEWNWNKPNMTKGEKVRNFLSQLFMHNTS